MIYQVYQHTDKVMKVTVNLSQCPNSLKYVDFKMVCFFYTRSIHELVPRSLLILIGS